MAYNVLDICRYVINYSNDKDYGISNLKLQKILYLIQAYFLIRKNEPCFHETIEAWDLGPVVPKAYREYKQFGSGDIPTVSYIVDFDKNNIWESKVRQYNDNIITSEDKKLIEAVVDKFSDYSATDLVTITHCQAPWKNAYQHGKNNEITINAIEEYFHG